MRVVLNLFFFIIFSIILFSCTNQLKLNGQYDELQHYVETSLSKEEIFSNIISFLTLEEIPISSIDKVNGVILSSKVSFIKSYTREKNSTPIDSNAYVVIPTVKGNLGNILEPNALISGIWTIDGNWSVNIKSENNKTKVFVRLLNLECHYTKHGLYNSIKKIPVSSTGVFEQKLLNTFLSSCSYNIF